MSAPVLQLVEAPTTDLNDVAAALRRLADDIERGAHGIAEARETFGDKDTIVRAVCVLRVSAQEPAVFAWGRMENMAQAYMDLHAGAQELMAMRRPER